MTPLISVIIPVYNGEKTIIHTLNSVLKQTYLNFEVIIVDDCSDTPVESLIQPLTKDNRIRIFRKERSNANTARNYGIRQSKGEYIAMLDADDYWLENHLHDCLALLRESDAGGLYGSLYFSKSMPADIHTLPSLSVCQARELEEDESMVDYLLTMGCGAQTSTLFTTALAMKNIMWNEKLIDHDYDFVVRFHKKYKMIVKKEPTVVYYLLSGRPIRYETFIWFFEEVIKEINPMVYTRYNLNMYIQAGRKEESKKFAPHFQKEATRYKECISYQQYISIRNPKNRSQEWIEKIKYLWYITGIHFKLFAFQKGT